MPKNNENRHAVSIEHHSVTDGRTHVDSTCRVSVASCGKIAGTPEFSSHIRRKLNHEVTSAMQYDIPQSNEMLIEKLIGLS